MRSQIGTFSFLVTIFDILFIIYLLYYNSYLFICIVILQRKVIKLPFFHYLTQKVREATQDEILLILSKEDIAHLLSNGVSLTKTIGSDGLTRYKVSSSLLKEIFLL